MAMLARLFVLPLAAAAAAGGCTVVEFSHYEPTVTPLASPAVYRPQLEASPRLTDPTVVYAEPLGVRAAPGGLIVDVLLSGEPLRDRLSPGEVWASEPVPLLAVSVSTLPGRTDPAGPPGKVVDVREPAPLGTFVDPADSLFLSILNVPGDVPTRVVSIAVVPRQERARGSTCYVRIIEQQPQEARMRAWLPPAARIVAPERELTVR